MFVAVSCDDESDSSSGNTTAVENSMVDLPSCISKTQSTTRSRESTDEMVKNIYEPIRSTLGGIDEWTKVAREVVMFFEKDVLPTADSGDWTNNDMKTEYDVKRIKWGASENTDYETHAEVFYQDAAGAEAKGMDIFMTVVDDAAKGYITFNLESMRDPQNPNEKAKLTVKFDGTQNPKIMEFFVVDMTGDSDDPTKLQAKGWFYDNNTFRVTTSYYFPTLDKIGEENSTDKEERTYTFTIVGYDEEGKDSTKKNKAVLKLAFPLVSKYQTTDTTNIFANDSVGKIYSDEVYSDIKADWVSNNYTISALELASGVDVASTDTNSLTNDEVEKILIGWSSNPTATDADRQAVSQFVYISKLVNPAYFTADGFFGTYDGTDGTLTEVPDWADNSDLAIDELDSEVISPSTVKALDFDPASFIVK